MFVPKLYRTDDNVLIRSVIDEHPLALLATNGAAHPNVTHLPSIVYPSMPLDVPLTGVTLVGHMNRANPHWLSLTDGQAVLLTFDSVGGYVSPVSYPPGPAAPTWNFVSVEVTGKLTLVRERRSTLEIVRATADKLEARFGDGWSSESSVRYFERIVGGVGAFRVEVGQVAAMFKLSQEKPDDVREAVIRRFERDDRGRFRDLARMMRTQHAQQAQHTQHTLEGAHEHEPVRR
jgi:transcriptional regulator